MHHQFSSGACPPSTLFGGGDMDVNFDMDAGAQRTYFPAQQQIPHAQQQYVDHSSYGFPLHNHSGQYPDMNFAYELQRSHHRHQSTSTQSSYSSAFHSSDGSVFSQYEPRNSIASTNTTWSQIEDYSREQHILQTERALDPRPPFASPSPQPATIEDASTVPPAKRATGPRPHHRQQPPKRDKDPFETCVSRTKRSRPPQKVSRYWCTSCTEGFGEKYDWKRHEETYQERTEMFACDLCPNIYFLDKDFVHHHQHSHRCRTCAENHHVDSARRVRRARTGWGCGFCSHFSADWTERCGHVGQHFEKDGLTMRDWHQTQVIFSLLQRPQILPLWNRLLEVKRRTASPFRWKPRSTGRVEGWPEKGGEPGLQDLLEFWRVGEAGEALVEMAFRLGLREKELPRLPEGEGEEESGEGELLLELQQRSLHPALPPPPPPPQQQPQPLPLTLTLPPIPSVPFVPLDLINDVPSWNTFLGTILEDEVQPDGVCRLDFDPFDVDVEQPGFLRG
ncbi:hypothetical protein P280DRAFT_510803 [Massarina eburnea CBS 473.64]|uniref:C2H2-type domain-containing protein n=1 Tax=Massarina eburnea CBS 473.64 TaxID=1395130 RepID=A0A6A6RLE4_9PLEO|nr:hypothetical protein P280DRAFT_510803 [Massarina eburnea CBS 473.64]